MTIVVIADDDAAVLEWQTRPRAQSRSESQSPSHSRQGAAGVHPDAPFHTRGGSGGTMGGIVIGRADDDDDVVVGGVVG